MRPHGAALVLILFAVAVFPLIDGGQSLYGPTEGTPHNPAVGIGGTRHNPIE
jgi:hypothetical protein